MVEFLPTLQRSIGSDIDTLYLIRRTRWQNEREDMQEKTFRKWVNLQLAKGNAGPIEDLFKDLRDGGKLLSLLEIITGQKLNREKGKTRVHWINNINRAVEFLQERKVRLVNINNTDIADGNPKITLGLIWTIIQNQWNLKDDLANMNELPIRELLLKWCQFSVKNSPVKTITDFTTSFKDGWAFNAILQKYRPELVDLRGLQDKTPNERLASAFLIAEQHLGVQRLIEPEDVNSDHIDDKSVLTYVMCLFQALPHDAFLEEQQRVQTPTTAAAAQADLNANNVIESADVSSALSLHQLHLEEVLTWLLDAEDKLREAGDIKDQLDELKEQFKRHEDFLVMLNNNQSNVAKVLQEGRVLAESGVLKADNIAGVQKQTELINEKWESLRTAAMNRQAKLQKKLSQLQGRKLQKICDWLAAMEHEIKETPVISSDSETAKKQLQTQKVLQEKVERQQESINALSQMVFVVDDSRESVETCAKMEATLKDIGQRWLAICQWVEKRSARLLNLPQSLALVSDEQHFFADWFDQREAGVSSLRSIHHLQSGNEFMEQVGNMEALQKNVESLHRRFLRFTETGKKVASVLEIDNHVGAANIRKMTEEMISRWDNILARIDEYASMLLKSGQGGSKALSGATWVKDSVSKIQHIMSVTNVPAALQKEGSEKRSKKARLELQDSQDDFYASCEKILKWLGDVETELVVYRESTPPVVQTELLREHIRNFEATEMDMSEHEEVLQVVLNQGYQVIRQLQSGNKDTGDAEKMVDELKSRWKDLQLLITEKRRSLEIAIKCDNFRSDLLRIDESVSELARWSDDFRPNALTDMSLIRRALYHCQDKLDVVKTREPEVEALQHQLESLTEFAGPDHFNVVKLHKEFDDFTAKWANVVDKISNALETLTEAIERAPAPNYESAIHELSEWLTSAEDILATENLAALDYPTITAAKIGKLRDLAAQIDNQKENLVFLEQSVAGSNEGGGTEQIQLLHERWLSVTKICAEFLEELQDLLCQLEDWELKRQELEKWLDDVSLFLDAEDPAVGDLETLRAQLDQSKGLIDDIETLRPKFQQILETAETLAHKATGDFSTYLLTRMKEIHSRWELVVVQTQTKHDSLEKAFDNSSRVMKEIEELIKWLNGIEEALHSSVDPQSGKELQTLLKKHRQLKEELKKGSSTIEDAVQLGKELLTSLESAESSAEHLKADLSLTLEKWGNISSHVDERLRVLSTAFENWKEFQELLAAERICLDQLERIFAEPMKPAADAEEFSEQLDLLERVMEGSGHHERIIQLGKSLLSENIIVDTVKFELERYKGRRNKLMEPARSRQKFLEAGVNESQEFETQMLSCQSWIAHVDYILESRLHSDILASDVPEEYKRALTAGTLMSQLSQEFQEHEACIDGLVQQVDTYRGDGRDQAASRLQEQIDHLKTQMAEVKRKFIAFQKPGDFDLRLARVSRILTDVDQSIEVIKIRSDGISYINEQLEKCQQMFDALTEVKSEVECVIEAGNKIIELQQADKPEELKDKLLNLKVQYNFLGAEVTTCRNDLEKAGGILRRIEDETTDLAHFFASVEAELNAWQPDQSVNVEERLQFIEDSQNELSIRQSSFKEIEDNLGQWRTLAGVELAESVEGSQRELTEHRDKLMEVLVNRKEILTKLNEENKTLLADMVTFCTDVEGWLNKAEPTVAQYLEESDAPEGLRIKLQNTHREANDLKPKLALLRDKAVELMAKGASYEKQVEPSLIAINTRWEALMQSLKGLQSSLQLSLSPVPASPITKSPADSPKVTPLVEVKSVPKLLAESTATVTIEKDQPPTQDLELKVGAAIRSVTTIEQMLSRRVRNPVEWASALDGAMTAFESARPQMRELATEGNFLATCSDKPHAQELSKALKKLSVVWDALEGRLIEQRQQEQSVSADFHVYQEELTAFTSWLDDLKKQSEKKSYEDIVAMKKILAGRATEFKVLENMSLDIYGKLPGASKEHPLADPEFAKFKHDWTEVQSTIDNMAGSSQTTSAASKSKEAEITIAEKSGDLSSDVQFGKLLIADELQTFHREVENIQAVLKATESDISYAPELCGGDYSNFSQQEDALKVIKQNLEKLEYSIEKAQEHKALLSQHLPEDNDRAQLDLFMNSLRIYFKSIKDAYKNKYNHFLLCFNRWQSFHRNIHNFATWLDDAEKLLDNCTKVDANLEEDTADRVITALQTKVADQEKQLRNISASGAEIVQGLDDTDVTVLTGRIDELTHRWQNFVEELRLQKDRCEDGYEENSDLNKEIDDLAFWLDETEALLTSYCDPTDRTKLNDLELRNKARMEELDLKKASLVNITTMVRQEFSSPKTPRQIQQSMDKEIGEAENRLRKIEHDIQEKLKDTYERVLRCSHFWQKLHEINGWMTLNRKKIEDYRNAKIYTPTQININAVKHQVSDRKADIDDLLGLFSVIDGESKKLEVAISESTVDAVNQLQKRYASLCEICATIEVPESSGGEDESVTSEDGVMTTSHHVETNGYSEIKKPSRNGHGSNAPELPHRGYEDNDAREEDIHVTKSTAMEQGDSKSAHKMREIVQLRHWLTDSQREVSGAIDITEQAQIKEALKKQQTFLDQLQTKRLQLIKILENSKEQELTHKAEILCRDWERCFNHVAKRKRELTQLVEDSRLWENLKAELEVWLNESESLLTGKKVGECTVEDLNKEIRVVECILPEFEHYKLKIFTLNEKSNKLIDTYNNDDTTTVSQVVSELNTQWSRLNDNFRVRRAVLEASLRGRKDFQSAIAEFFGWLKAMEAKLYQLDNDTCNPQAIKDTANRKIWLNISKDLKAEVTAHAEVLASLQETGQKLLETVESPVHQKDVGQKLAEINQRWEDLRKGSEAVHLRLETAQEQWERLTTLLREEIYWIETNDKALTDQQPLGSDLERLRTQKAFAVDLQRDMDARSSRVTETLELVSSYLLQQDMRPRMGTPGSSDEDDAAVSAENSARRVAQIIRSESETLKDRWNKLKDRVARWTALVDESLPKMERFDDAVHNCESSLKEAELTHSKWIPVKDIRLEELPSKMNEIKTFRNSLGGLRGKVDDVNDKSSCLLAENVHLSKTAAATLDSVNNRFKQLETAIGHRIHALNNALRDFGPSSQHFLAASVIRPWERAISSNRVPYYVNHDTEKTQWDHPSMVHMMDKLCEFNDVKFSAYRTSMKLRVLQKKLCFDLIGLEEMIEIFDKQGLLGVNEKSMDVTDIVLTLLPCYEKIHQRYPDLVVSVPVIVDLCLNWILNVYDPARSGCIRALSLKIAISLLCRAHLEDKYRFMFSQVVSCSNGIDQKKMALLLHDALQIPKFLGEVAAFGGTNIEPSVRSCFEKAKYPQEITVKQFLEWQKCEPQSMVWMPVMHRVAAAETAKHQAKCNVCKMFPIVGLRYRCLKCFNFDMCQNCFFSQRKAKGHKLAHPMQEYCVASTSGEDVRDFSKVIKNKFKTKGYWRKHPRLGYLPVQSVDEGDSIESRSSTPNNPNTQDMHSRLESYALRLAAVERSNLGSPGGNGEDLMSDDEHNMIASYSVSLTAPDSSVGVPPKSPAQIVTAIDGVQREELESLVNQLEEENRLLQAEYDRLKTGVGAAISPPLPMTNGSLGRKSQVSLANPSTNSLPPASAFGGSRGSGGSEYELLAEAKALRLHKARLEQRMGVLEEHNKQLEAQLIRLKELIDEQSISDMGSGYMSPSYPGNLSSSNVPATAQGFQLGSLPKDVYGNGHHHQQERVGNRIGDLMSMAEDVGRAMSSLVQTVTSDEEFSSGDEK